MSPENGLECIAENELYWEYQNTQNRPHQPHWESSEWPVSPVTLSSDQWALPG